MCKIITCAMCGFEFDRSACNQTHSVITIVVDRDETGTKHERSYLCGGCSVSLAEFLRDGNCE